MAPDEPGQPDNGKGPAAFFGTLAMVSTIVGFLKSAVGALASIFFVRANLPHEIADAFLAYLRENHRRVGAPAKGYTVSHLFVRPEDRRRRVVFEQLTYGVQLFLVKRALIVVIADKENKEGWYSNKHGVWFLRGTLDFEKLLLAVTEWEDEHLNERKSGRYAVYRMFGEGYSIAKSDDGDETPRHRDNVEWMRFRGIRPLRWAFEDLGPPQSDRAIGYLSLTDSLERLVCEVMRWFKSERWHKDRGIPWRRGYLFYGPQGTGKTSFARAIAEELDLPVFAIDLSTMTNGELVKAWAKVLAATPCMVILEDIDTVFKGRENVAKGMLGGVSFDCLLNCIDGIERSDGVLTIVTTNHPDLLDPALAGTQGGDDAKIASRPGRIDRSVLFTPLDEAGRVKLASRIVGPQYPDLMAQVLREGIEDSAAQFQERCARLALEAYYAFTETAAA